MDIATITSDLELTFGELSPFIQDRTIEEIWINTPERIFIAKNGRSELTTLILTSEIVRNIVDRALMWSGRRLDLSQPFVDARLPDGSRLHVTIPEITADHWAVNIRKHVMRNMSLDQLVAINVMSAEIADYLKKAIVTGSNILVSGGTQAGKTTLLNALIGEIPPNERVITVEEVFELKPNLPDVVAMQTRTANLQGDGEIPLRKLIKESLRMRPSRLIVGEVREAEALDLLIALNSGLPGMGTIHANSTKSALVKLQTLPLLAGENISQKFITPTVASAINILIHVANRDGARRVVEVSKTTGRIENDFIESENLWKWNGANYEKGFGLNEIYI